MIQNINFKQPKYIIPTIAYVGLLIIGYFVIDLFGVEIKKDSDNGLKTTEYLNSDLPQANVRRDIGSKRQNVRNTFGNITDFSAIDGIDENSDTTYRRKEEYESRYSEEDLALLEQQRLQAEEIKRLQDELAKRQGGGRSQSDGDFVMPMTDEERQQALENRRSSLMEQLDRDLNNSRSSGVGRITDRAVTGTDSVASSEAVREVVIEKNAVHSLDESAKDLIVTKKSRDDSDYFNTVSENTDENRLIRAIVDEELKLSEAGRVRLRLLDDIEIGGTTLRKGTYLYAMLNISGKQRVTGKVESVLVGDDLLKINLSIYDVSDGLEGLYVPGSPAMETARDIGSSALSGSLNVSNDISSGGNNLARYAGQALQNAYQRTSNAISKAIKKKKVRIKYGTQVYLVNSRSEKSKR